MIRKIISKLFKRSDSPAHAQPKHVGHKHYVKPVQLGRKDHKIDRHLVSHNAIKTCETLQRAGFEAFIVGGAVRDLLLGIAPKDFDVATNAEPEEVQKLFRRARIIGKRFRIVHVVFGNDIIETSTFRALHGDKVETDAHGRVLRDNVFGSQHEDATRRDFTVNALYYDPTQEIVLDYHHGVRDLRAKTLRMIGDPATRYREDPVRMLRVVRFAAKLGFEIDATTRAPIAELADLIENVPASRLFDEMLKLLTSGHALACLQRLRQEGLHQGLMPLLDVILEQPAGEKFVTLALSRTDERVRAGKSISPSFLFASLLWNLVKERWQVILESGEHTIPALFQAMDEIISQQCEKLAIQRRFTTDMREIWALQPRFEKRNGASPYRLLEHLRFRAGYDFLLLRTEVGELESELADWWTAFQVAEHSERAQMIADANRRAPAIQINKRKRRRKPKNPAGATSGTSQAE
ncbi:polynucleotide adenylyltransferase PcnB [Parvibium lacunae]|uniref:Poly(A) polymerase I n=1 Tax=Parvibium lacunae TaxID=1888893 RepID=A0A368L1C5_9BURK|nr:polynucleotide adenylyltransferase PcnB [Parvibium lacunae]RCS57355.1 polynucleotide adenylyltransferase PcnB [Parvibium lacunae]